MGGETINFPVWTRFDKPAPHHRPEFAVHEGKTKLDNGEDGQSVVEYLRPRYTLYPWVWSKVFGEMLHHRICTILRLKLRQNLSNDLV